MQGSLAGQGAAEKFEMTAGLGGEYLASRVKLGFAMEEARAPLRHIEAALTGRTG